MMPDWHIEKLVWPENGRQSVFVPEERSQFGAINNWQLQPASLDVRLAGDFLNHPGGLPFKAEYWVEMPPGDCLLACLVERFSLPDNVVARVEGKSSWARKFLTVHSAGFIDPGFRGDITLELKNDGTERLRLPIGSPIAQVSFQFLDAPARRPYGSVGLESHYQGQTGANASRI